MRFWLKLLGVFVAIALVVVVMHWRSVPQRFGRIHARMTCAEVKAIMGRDPDDDSKTPPGHSFHLHVQIWRFVGLRETAVSVEFDADGRAIAKTYTQYFDDAPYAIDLEREVFSDRQ